LNSLKLALLCPIPPVVLYRRRPSSAGVSLLMSGWSTHSQRSADAINNSRQNGLAEKYSYLTMSCHNAQDIWHMAVPVDRPRWAKVWVERPI
jgi:hypothetical protein